jgi:hypothetical protein
MEWGGRGRSITVPSVLVTIFNKHLKTTVQLAEQAQKQVENALTSTIQI